MNHKSPRQYSDQMVCSTCGRAWDVNDPDPPPCTKPTPKFIKRDDLSALIEKLKST